MINQSSCPQCGAQVNNGVTREYNFHQSLYWENENPQRGEVHHLMVLAYHLQHPSFYSPEGLEHGIQLLVDFIEHGISPQLVLKNNQMAVDSTHRKWNIGAKAGRQAAYKDPVHWKMTIQAVVCAGPDQYIESVQDWSRAIFADLRSSGNLS